MTALAAATFALLTTEIWHSSGPTRWEGPIISATTRYGPPGADSWRTLFDPAPFAVITLLIAAFALLDRRPRLAIAGTVGSLGAAIAAEHVLKPIVERRRVYHWYPWFHPRGGLGSLSFPSGHVAAAAACATFAWFVLARHTRAAAIVFAVPILVGWAMMSLELHYPADVIAGAILGVGAVCATVLVADALFGRDTPATAARPTEPDPIGSS